MDVNVEVLPAEIVPAAPTTRGTFCSLSSLLSPTLWSMYPLPPLIICSACFTQSVAGFNSDEDLGDGEVESGGNVADFSGLDSVTKMKDITFLFLLKCSSSSKKLWRKKTRQVLELQAFAF